MSSAQQTKKRAPSIEEEDPTAKKQRIDEEEGRAEEKRRDGRDFLRWLFMTRRLEVSEDDECPGLVMLFRSVLRRDFAGFKRGHRFPRVVWNAELLRLELYESTDEECLPVVAELGCIVREIWRPSAALRDMTATDKHSEERFEKMPLKEQYLSLSDNESETDDQ